MKLSAAEARAARIGLAHLETAEGGIVAALRRNHRRHALTARPMPMKRRKAISPLSTSVSVAGTTSVSGGRRRRRRGRAVAHGFERLQLTQPA